MRPRRLYLTSAAFAAIALGCFVPGGCTDEPIDPAPNVVSISDGTYVVSVDTVGLRIELVRGDEIVTTLDGQSLSLGTVDEVRDEVNYDPYPLVAASPGYLPPAGVAFHPARRIVDFQQGDDSIDLDLEHEGGLRSHASIRVEAEGRFRIELVPSDASKVAWLRVGATAAADEAFYGLGEYFDDVNHRGRIRAMQIEVDELESGYNEAHAPVPFLVGTNGWGLFVETSYPGVFDVAASSSDRVEATFGLGTASSAGVVAHLYAAPHPLDVTKLYFETTSFPRLPAPWALGPLVWRDENDDQAQVESDLEIMRDLDLPTSGIWIDRPYATAVNTFDFDPAKFTDPQAMIDHAHALGFRVALWHVPYLDEKDPATQKLRAAAEEADVYPVESGITFNKWGKPIDFTAPGAVDFWRDNLRAYTSMGIEGFKLDYAEDVVPGAFGARNVYRFHDGSDERTMHRGYTLLYHETYGGVLPEEGGLLLCRAAKWGDQKHGIVVWPGDVDARMWKHGEEITEDGETFRAVGGLHASMVAGLTLGPSGFPFYGADTGGYRHAPPDKETFIRWFEQTALSSVMQIGTSTNDVAWEFDDDELLDLYRQYTRLHLRLFPYEWTLAQGIAKTGHPIQRPFGLQEPSYGEHPSDQYFFGDALLVAPVTEAGATTREVFLPSGRWIDFFDGTILEGPGLVTVDAPLSKLPLFVREGAVVPLLRPTIDTLSPTTDPDRVDSFATDAGDLFAVIAPGHASSFELYDGSRIAHATEDGVTTLDVSAGETFDRNVVVELVAFGDAPSHVGIGELTLEAADSLEALLSGGQGYYFDPLDRGGTVWVKIAWAVDSLHVTIERQ
ncbi:MAG: glycoside hydrolase family 31 protein [Polyangiaceae bacterium]|nr:glycoside hydrolase family 31 protein [Polyangiaceae bacterium]